MWIEYDADPKAGATIFLTANDGDFIRIDRGINWASVAKASHGDAIPAGAPLIIMPAIGPRISIDGAQILRRGIDLAVRAARWMDSGRSVDRRPKAA